MAETRLFVYSGVISVNLCRCLVFSPFFSFYPLFSSPLFPLLLHTLVSSTLFFPPHSALSFLPLILPLSSTSLLFLLSFNSPPYLPFP